MRITTRLAMISAGTLAALVILLLGVGLSFAEFRSAKADYLLADQIRDGFVERTSIRDEYLLYREERAHVMWEHHKAVGDQLVSQARAQFRNPKNRQILGQLSRYMDENTAIFRRIVANTQNLNQSHFQELDKRLVSQLLLRAMAVRDAAAELQEVTKSRVDQAFRRLAVVIALFGFTVALLTILTTLQIRKVIRRRLGPLHAGLSRVAEGNLDHRIPDHGSDEFSELARSVNGMTEKLQVSTRQLGEEISRRLVAAAERENERQFQALLDNLSAGVVVHAPNTEVLFSNAMAGTLLGLTKEQMQGKTAMDPRWRFLREDGSPMPLEEYPVNRVLASGQGFHGRVIGVCRPELVEPTWVLCNAFPERDEQGTVRQAVVTFSDISDHKRMAEEKAKLQFQLQQSQKMESLGILAGGVAHDMNNVLGAILGLSSAHLELQPAASPAFRAFETITKAANRGRDLVKGLLSFARRDLAVSSELDMNTILREEVLLLEHTTLSKVRIELDLSGELRRIRGDGSALTHALMNLCVNAVDAMPDQGILTFRTRNVDNGWIEVRVEDSGVGMTQEVLARAMDPFFTTKEVGKGTGLGLPLVYSTVTAHRGQMEIESEPGRGTCVILRFPASNPEAADPPASAGPVLRHSGRALQVLLVDDDELIQGATESLLEVMGHAATTACSGEEALALLEAGYRPEVVILDMNMPGLGGAGTLPRLRAMRPELPVLLATGRVDQVALDLATGIAGVSIMPKPFSMEELSKHLEEVGLG